MKRYEEVEQLMHQMHLIESHERPEAIIGKTISFFTDDRKMKAAIIQAYEVEMFPRDEASLDAPRNVEIFLHTGLFGLIRVTRKAGVVAWMYDDKALDPEDTGIR